LEKLKKPKNNQQGVTASAEIRTGYLRNSSLERYCYAKFLDVSKVVFVSSFKSKYGKALVSPVAQ
jgi:hypothetical protein